jgi:small-conductance mechanosensitive channel
MRRYNHMDYIGSLSESVSLSLSAFAQYGTADGDSDSEYPRFSSIFGTDPCNISSAWRNPMGCFRSWKNWLVLATAVSSMGIMLSCQTKEPRAQSKALSVDVRLLSRIGRAVNRYHNSLDLAGYAQTAVERSLAERHCQINRDILKMEFARVKLEIEEMGVREGKNQHKQAGQKAEVERQSEKDTDEAVKIQADIARATQEVAQAEQQQKRARSPQEMKQAQDALTRAQQASEIATKEMDLHETNLKLADSPPTESEVRDDLKSLQDRIASLEKEALGKEGTDAPALKWGEPINASGSDLMDAFRSWWNYQDKGTVLGTAEQRAKRISDDLKDSFAENQQLSRQLRKEQQELNPQIRMLYGQANELLKQPGQNEEISKLLKEADAKMNASLINTRRREKIDRIQDIFQQQLSLAAEDTGRLASWSEVVSNSRARAQTRLLRQLGSLLGMIAAVFIVAYFIKKIPKRFVKEEKSAHYFRKLIGFVAWSIVILMAIFDIAGGIGSISAVIGLAGAGLAIALQDPIVSLVGWFLIVGRYGISVGDRIEINNVRGDVIDVGMLRIAVMEVGNWLSGEQSTGRMVFFPNSFIFKGHFFNYSMANSFIWDEIHVLVTYESQWKKACDLILKAAKEASQEVVERARMSQDQLARRFNVNLGNLESYAYVTIADSGVDLVLRYLSEIKQRRVMHDRICREILDAFEKEPAIKLAYPTQRQLTETRIIGAPGSQTPV